MVRGYIPQTQNFRKISLVSENLSDAGGEFPNIPSFGGLDGLDTILSNLRQYTPYGHFLINNPSLAMCQETHPYRAISIGSVQIDASLWMMSECSILKDPILREAPLSQNRWFFWKFLKGGGGHSRTKNLYCKFYIETIFDLETVVKRIKRVNVKKFAQNHPLWES